MPAPTSRSLPPSRAKQSPRRAACRSCLSGIAESGAVFARPSISSKRGKTVHRHGGDPRLRWRPRLRLSLPRAKRLSAADESADDRLSSEGAVFTAASEARAMPTTRELRSGSSVRSFASASASLVDEAQLSAPIHSKGGRRELQSASTGSSFVAADASGSWDARPAADPAWPMSCSRPMCIR